MPPEDSNLDLLQLILGPSQGMAPGGGSFFGLSPLPQPQDTQPPPGPDTEPGRAAAAAELGLVPTGIKEEWDPTAFNPDTGTLGRWVTVTTYGRPSATGGAGDALAGRQFGLNKLTSALSAYLQGTSAVADRRLSAFQQAANLLPFTVDPSQEFFSGFEPEGALASVAGQFGIPSTPAPIQHRQLNVGALAQTPELDPQVAALIQQIQGA